MLYVRRVAVFVPQSRLNVEELRDPLELTDVQVQLYRRFLGMRRIAVAPEHSVLEMLTATGEAALAGADRAGVRYLIHAHTMQHAVPDSAELLARLREKLGLEHTRSFALSHQNCAAGLYTLRLAASLLRTERTASTALLLGGEKVLSPLVQQNAGLTLLGEAAAGWLVGGERPGHEVLSVAYRVLSGFHEVFGMTDEARRRYERAYIPTIAEVAREAAEAAGTSPGQVGLILPHNVNRLFLQQFGRALGVPGERVFTDNVSELGHCFCADPFINLSSALTAGLLRTGDLALLVSAGLGATFSAAVIRVGEEVGTSVGEVPGT
ncbi:3-oxoacyl-ACP synthase [Streptomyces sp. A0958]|uniref:3-oxoacyl-[acyl-carrier-protein] synthase III C-terminal domain-containing protein n=1 Tax=Streptomyces sp. A0958 TaxID=2563101 RepID=UPI00109E5CCA|nr:3-oxoacyl-[acyl-carrier-protein] synthase III C-terminal domain-containing protein [Streptomyces sp. A0958]THA59944.1 3-oxoacyl-ACP synthase [Streptomyces sp. A0958]